MRSKRTQVKRGKPRKKVEPLEEGMAGKKKKRRTFTKEEVQLIKRRYVELVKEGLNDNQISVRIGEELDRTPISVEAKIRRLKKNGIIWKNPNKQKTKGRLTDDEIELIKRRYAELVEEGLNDAEISKKIGKELGRSAGTVRARIKKMRKSSRIKENPNKKENRKFTGKEVELIKRGYAKLVGEGLNDTDIARKIANELDRDFGSVRDKIGRMRKDEEIDENPNMFDRKEFSDKENELIKRRYSELIKKGLSDRNIAKKIGKESRRNFGSVEQKIKKMRQDGTIGENPNNRINVGLFSEEEIILIKKRYVGLVQEGLNDIQIAKNIGSELGRSTYSINHKIREMRKGGEIEGNPNNRKIFDREEIELVKRRYAELAQEGLNDVQISKVIGGELGRNEISVASKITRLKKSGEFADAEALREKQDILGVVKALEEFGEEE